MTHYHKSWHFWLSLRQCPKSKRWVRKPTLSSVLFTKFTESELNYEIHDKELLVIVKAFIQWKTYLERLKNPGEVYTDYKNLIYFMTTKVLNRWQVWWSEKLSNFYFKIHYQKGSENAKADALSQRPDYMKNKPQIIQSVLSQQQDRIIMYKTWTIITTIIIINNKLKSTIWAKYLKDK